MENYNTFNPPVDDNVNTPPTEPAEPVAPDEPEEKLDESAPTEFGATSDYNGYGTNEKGYDIEKSDLGPDFYNAQAHRGAEALYAAAEKEQEDAEKAAFPDWYGTEADVKKAQHELLNEAMQDISAMHEALDRLEEKIKAEISKAERIAIEKQNPESTPPSGGAPATPGSMPLSSTEVRDITTASAPAPSNAMNSEPSQQFVGKGQIIYHSAEDARSSFED